MKQKFKSVDALRRVRRIAFLFIVALGSTPAFALAPTADPQSVSTPEDVALAITLTGTDPESDPLTFAVVTGPSNGTLSGAAPDLTYTPSPNFNGADSFTFTASDASLTSDAATISITVTAVNDPPTALAQSVSTAEDVALAITLTGTDPESDPLTFAVATGPSNGTLSGVVPNLTYTPNPGFNGADSLTFTASDGSLASAAATISITVTAVNDAPTALAQSVSTPEDVALAITLTGTDPDSDPLTFAVATGPSNGTLSGVAPNLTYTPSPNFNGADSFTFTASDASLTSAAATISITVSAVNDAPTALAQSASTAEDVAVAITLTGTDPDSDPLTFAVVTGPSNGTLSGVVPNLTYAPNPGFNGADSFTFTVSDASLTSAAATISITVTAVNDAPTALAQSVSTDEDVAVAITLTGTDPDSDPLTFAVATGPSNGTLSGVAPNLTYAPSPGFNGADSFTFTASDGSLTSAAATISITVNAVNDAPTADPQSVSTDEDVPLAITLTGTDPDSDPLTFAVVSGPSNGTLSGTVPDLIYTPNLEFSGADSFTFTVSDASLTSAAATISITVNDVNDPPIALAQSVSTLEDKVLKITLTGTDAESDPLTFTVVAQPTSGTLTGTAPDLTYTPNANFNGADDFIFTVNDGVSTSAAATISITVDAVNDVPIPTPIEDQFAIEGTEFNLDVSVNFTDADNDVMTFTASGLPPSGNLSFDPQTGVFSGTPLFDDALDNAPYPIVVIATDNQPGTIPAQIEFQLIILALNRANVSLDISVAPDPAMLNDELLWTLTAKNTEGPQAATNIELTGSFVGSGLSISSTGSCTIQAAVDQVSDFVCSLGDLPVGGSATVNFTTTTSTPGDVVVFASAASTDAVPIDPFIADNSGQIAVGVAEAFSLGAVQMLGNAELRSIAAGDMDGDGAVDLIVGTAAGQPIQIYLSSGFRDFASTAITIPDNASNEGIAVADFDRSGTQDIVVANGGGQADVVYSNDGDGNFTVMATLEQTFGRDVATGDFNNDGFLDIVFATIQGNPVYLGDGIGGFASLTTLGTANSQAVAVGKFNGDALDDIVFANTGGDSQVWINSAGSGFVQGDSLAIGDAVAVTVGEFGGDVRPDLAFARVSSGAGDLAANPVLINDGAGGFGVTFAELGRSSTNDIHAADVNGDGLTDLVFINASSVHQIWTANGRGFELYREQIVDADSSVGTLAELGETDVGDTDDDVDLAMGGAAAAGLGVFLNDGFGNLGRGDAVVPVLTLLGDAAVAVPSGSAYVDGGATAEDNIDGDISNSVVVNNPVNTALVGSYVVTYNVTDFAGNSAASISRTVSVTPAAGTGGGGGGATSPLLLILLMLAVSLTLYHGKSAIIQISALKQNQ